MFTLSFLFIVLVKVLFYLFKELVLRVILRISLRDFFYDYNFNFYVAPIQIKYVSGRALLYVFYVLFFVFV